jgi:hypothetical protein
VRTGRRWIVLDADFFANHFTDRILERFGPAGVCLFVALLCAAKRSRTQGHISYASDAEALDILGLRNLPLANSSGDKWTLDDFWKFTGTQKQTSRTYRGRVKNVKVTNWSQWQESLTREFAAQRQRRWRATNGRDNPVTANEQVRDSRVTDIDLDNDIDKDMREVASQRGQVNPQTPDLPRPQVPEWVPEPTVNGTPDPSVIANLRAAIRGDV